MQMQHPPRRQSLQPDKKVFLSLAAHKQTGLYFMRMHHDDHPAHQMHEQTLRINRCTHRMNVPAKQIIEPARRINDSIHRINDPG
jgi:hypothetical protein